MKRDKKAHEKQEELESMINDYEIELEGGILGDTGAEPEAVCDDPVKKELETAKAQLEDKSRQCEELLNKLQRTAAEFDNFKKRTAREKESLYSDATGEVVSAFLPVIDNFERAIQAVYAVYKEEDKQTFKDGIELVFRQIKDVMKNLGIQEIKSVGEKFDPQLHNAVMHIEDEAFGDSTVIEEFQKGYILNEKVIRHSMVKVAN